MIQSIQFKNFKALRDTQLSLSRFTVMIGPNGSGKSTAFQALQAIGQSGPSLYARFMTVGHPLSDAENLVEITLRWSSPSDTVMTEVRWTPDGHGSVRHLNVQTGGVLPDKEQRIFKETLSGIRVYSLNPIAIANPVMLRPSIELGQDGGNLAGVLDHLRDRVPERFEELNKELARCIPEFDRMLFDTPYDGQRAFLLRTREGHHAIPAHDLSQGTLFALAILTLAYLPSPPSMVCLEEPDRGIHPRLLRDVQDALYRLSYPENYGEKRAPVQVITTTHSPYFLDLYRDHPEEVVIASKIGLEARFERLSERKDIAEILGDAPLGEVWYSGILGGVPAER